MNPFPQLNDDVDQEIYDEIDMRLRPTEYMLPYGDIMEIAEQYGKDEMDVAEMVSSFVMQREHMKQEELKEAVEQFMEEFEGHFSSFREFYMLWKQEDYYEFDWAQEKDLRKIYTQMTTDPNQMSLFSPDQMKDITVEQYVKLANKIINE